VFIGRICDGAEGLVHGTKPTEYETGVDAQAVHGGHSSVYLKGKKPAIDGFGTLMQDFKADQ
jgi:hypothetical protein